MQIEIGKSYIVNHARKGRFAGKLVRDEGEFVEILISSGKATAMLKENEADPGEKITIRRSLCTFEPLAA